MKSIINKKIALVGAGIAFAIMVFVLGGSRAEAYVLLDTSVSVSNYTQDPDCDSCWSSSVNANTDDYISVRVDFQNRGTSPANGVYISLTPQTSSNDSVSFRATISATNGPSDNASATVNIPTNESISFASTFQGVSGIKVYNSAGDEAYPSDGTDLFSGQGLELGTVNAADWDSGTFVVKYQVSDSNFNPNGGGSTDEPDVETESARDIDEDSAELRGNDDTNDTNDVTVAFVWSTDKDDVEDAEDENDIDDVDPDDGDVEIIERDVNDNESDDVEENITSLDEDTKYYFALCVEFDNKIECGSIKSFTTDGEEVVPITSGDAPLAATWGPTSIGQTVTTVNGHYTANDTDTSVWFEYGTTQGLGLSSSPMIRSKNTSGPFAATLSGLVPNTLYFYKAVAQNNDGRADGSILSFRTVSSGGVYTPPVSTGGSSSFVKLDIENGTEVITGGATLAYDVEWEAKATLKDAILQIVLPKELRFVSSTNGIYNKRDHAITVDLGDVARGEKDDITVTVRARGISNQGDVIVAQAVLAFTTTSGAQETAIDYDDDMFQGGLGLGAGLFGFLPGSILGWLVFALLILLIVLAVRALAGRKAFSSMITHRVAPKLDDHHDNPPVARREPPMNIPM